MSNDKHQPTKTTDDHLLRSLEQAKLLHHQVKQKRHQFIVDKALQQKYAGPIKIEKNFKHVINPISDYNKDKRLKKVQEKHEIKIERIQSELNSRQDSIKSSSSSSSKSSSFGFHSHSPSPSSHYSRTSSDSSITPTLPYQSPNHPIVSSHIHDDMHSHPTANNHPIPPAEIKFSRKLLSKKGQSTEKWLDRANFDEPKRESYRLGLIRSATVLEAEKADKKGELLKRYNEKLENRRTMMNKNVQKLLPKIPFSLENKVKKVTKSQEKHLKSFNNLKNDIKTHLNHGNLHHSSGGKDDIFNWIDDARESMKNTRLLIRIEKHLPH